MSWWARHRVEGVQRANTRSTYSEHVWVCEDLRCSIASPCTATPFVHFPAAPRARARAVGWEYFSLRGPETLPRASQVWVLTHNTGSLSQHTHTYTTVLTHRHSSLTQSLHTHSCQTHTYYSSLQAPLLALPQPCWAPLLLLCPGQPCAPSPCRYLASSFRSRCL